ncbi:MAG: FG-GAP-like repeat-containing protein [Candidatus Sulfotelmatobacter sp.]|jgi:VCBS repeat protein/centrosomal CEP192-like protein/FG-GAP repeat protein
MRSLCLLLAMTLFAAPLFASNPIPTIDQPLVPTSVPPGSGPFVLTVNGSAFVSGAVVNWNGKPLKTQFVSQRRLRALVPGTDVVRATTASITVTNPATGGPSFAVFFTVTVPTPSVTFAALPGFTVGTSITQVAAADFNNDGKMDLAVLYQGTQYTCSNGTVGSNYISSYLGNGDGTFTAAGSLQLDCSALDGNENYAFTVANFTNDGYPDLAVSFTGTECCFDFGRFVAVYPGNGDGTFSALPTSIAGSVGDEGGPATAGDFNGDGNLDVEVEGADLGSVLWFLQGASNGTLGIGGTTELDPAGDFAGLWLAAGDFNNDGILDIVTPEVDAGTPTILLGIGDGTFIPAPSQPALSLSAPAIGDFNGDDNLDLAFAGPAATELSVLLGNGDGTFTVENNAPNNGPYATPLTADLNGDGKLDLAAGQILLGNGDGTFQAGINIGAGSEAAIADFNGDGRLDLVTVAGNSITILLQAGTSIPSPSSLKFPRRPVGTTSAAKPITLTNSGSATLQISSLSISGDFEGTNNCGSTLAIGQSCQIDVVFKPTAIGLRTGNITIAGNGASNPQLIPLSGTGY